MPYLTDATTNYSITEKVQYALKTALYRTMQTAHGDSAASEKSAPLRIFPNNIMKVNLIEKDAGDIDEDGYYVGKADSNSAWNGSTDLVDLENAELTIAKYKIINPDNNIITDIKVETLAGTYATKNVSYINGRPTSGQTYPWKNWFFRGHYVGATDALKYAAANDTYDGLQLAWDKSTSNSVASESDIVPHLKYYLQVQTDYTNVATSGNEDNITYIHDKMKGMIGLDQNFSSSIVVCQGEGGGSTNLGATGGSAGDYWFTQPTAGIVSFYGVGNSGTAKVASNLGLSNLATTKFPMISFVRYTGETGFGAGTGGGDAYWQVDADNLYYDGSGNVGIGTANPTKTLDVSGNINLTGTLYQNGSAAVFSNWINPSATSTSDIYRNSKVAIGQASTNGTYQLYVSGNTYITGTITGTLSGNATTSSNCTGTATYTSNVHFTNHVTNATNCKILMLADGHSGGWKNTSGAGIHNETDGLRYNINTHTLYANTFSGALSGTATYTSNVHFTNHVTNATNCKILMLADGHSGGWTNSSGAGIHNETDGLRYNINSHILYANTFSGALSGNATTSSNCTGTAAYTSNVHFTNLPVAATNCKILMLADGHTGGWKNTSGAGIHNETDGLRYNINTHTLYANTFSGALSGNAATATSSAGDWLVGPYAKTISGFIDMEDGGSWDSNTYYAWDWGTGPMGPGNQITVQIGRGVHTSGSWYGGSCLVVTFVPSHYGYLGYSQYYVHHYSTRGSTTIGKIQCHGLWSWGRIWLRGDRKYYYVVKEGAHPNYGSTTISSADAITVGSVVSQSWSDDRIKHNETEIINGLDIINQLKPLRYIKTKFKIYDKDHHFVLDDDGTPIDISGNRLDINAWEIEDGIIAQEIEKIEDLKHVVRNSTTEDEHGNVIKTVKYKDIFVYNIAATQELSKKFEILEEENALLKSELAAIKTHLGI